MYKNIKSDIWKLGKKLKQDTTYEKILECKRVGKKTVRESEHYL